MGGGGNASAAVPGQATQVVAVAKAPTLAREATKEQLSSDQGTHTGGSPGIDSPKRAAAAGRDP
jgi:hypothetical protein